NIHPVSFQSTSQPESEKNTHPAPDFPKLVSKKVPPPIPPKPDHLKISTNSSNTENVVSEPADISNNNNNNSIIIEFLDILLAGEQSDNKQEPLGIPGPFGISIKSQSIETKTEVKSLDIT